MMIDWLLTNWLALCGVIIGTIALILNFVRYRHTVHARSVRLAVSFDKVKEYESNLKSLEETKNNEPWSRTGMVRAYNVKVRNLGSVVAHIEDAGLITKDGVRKHALSHDDGGLRLLVELCEIADLSIAPKSSRTFEVYLRSNEKPYEVRKVYVVDRTGKEWKG